MAAVIPYDERRLFSRCKVLPAVRDALQLHDVTGRDDVTDTLVPGHRFVVFEADSGCSPAIGPLAAFDLRDKQKVFRNDFASTNSALCINPQEYYSFVR